MKILLPYCDFKIDDANIVGGIENFIRRVYTQYDNVTLVDLNPLLLECGGDNSSRDFIHPDDVIEALFHMIKNQLTFDFNVCSGKSFFLPNIIRYLNKNNKKIIFNGKKNGNLIGSNLKLQKKGWFLRNKINYNIFN